MVKPTIHRNGTSKDELLNQLITAGDAIAEAIKATANASPNARDYYPQGNGVFSQAIAAHVSRMTRLQDVLEELSDLAEYVADA